MVFLQEDLEELLCVEREATYDRVCVSMVQRVAQCSKGPTAVGAERQLCTRPYMLHTKHSMSVYSDVNVLSPHRMSAWQVCVVKSRWSGNTPPALQVRAGKGCVFVCGVPFCLRRNLKFELTKLKNSKHTKVVLWAPPTLWVPNSLRTRFCRRSTMAAAVSSWPGTLATAILRWAVKACESDGHGLILSLGDSKGNGSLLKLATP